MEKTRRKNYFVKYHQDNANIYTLRWCYEKSKNAKAKLAEAGYQRIDKKSAINLAYRGYLMNLFDEAAGDCADRVIYPWNYNAKRDEYDPENWGFARQYKFYKENYIILRY